MERNERFTEIELLRMKAYEERTGQRILYTFEEKCDIYRRKPKSILEGAVDGIQRSIIGRMNLDNEDSFDSPDDVWKLKLLQENLEAIQKVLTE